MNTHKLYILDQAACLPLLFILSMLLSFIHVMVVVFDTVYGLQMYKSPLSTSGATAMAFAATVLCITLDVVHSVRGRLLYLGMMLNTNMSVC